MPIRRRLLCNPPGSSAADRDDVYKRIVVLLRVVADRKQGCIGRDTVVIVAPDCEPRIDRCKSASVQWQPFNSAVPVKEKGTAIPRPVRGLEASLVEITHSAVR